MISYFVEGHPRTQHRPRLGRGRIYMDPSYKAWRDRIGYVSLQHVHSCTRSLVIVGLTFFSDTWEKQDIDNLIKAPLEALQGIAYYDDRQVSKIMADKRPGNGLEGVRIRIWTNDDPHIDYTSIVSQLLTSMMEEK